MKYANLNSYMFESMLNMIVDMEYTPFIQVNEHRTNRPIFLPTDYVDEMGNINLNISTSSIMNWELDKESGILRFSATFSGQHSDLVIPCESIIAVFAKENDRVVYVFRNHVAFMTGAGTIEGVEPEEFISNIQRHEKQREEKTIHKTDKSVDVKDNNNLNESNIVQFGKKN